MSEIGIFAIFFVAAFVHLDEGVDLGGRTALGTFEILGAAASSYLLSRSKARLGNAAPLDWRAGTVATQAVGAQLLFSKNLFLLLQIDACVVGWPVSHLVPGAIWNGTIVGECGATYSSLNPAYVSDLTRERVECE